MKSAVAKVAPVVIALPALSRELTITAEWMEKIHGALVMAMGITAVGSKADYDAATAALAEVTSLPNQLEKQRLALTKPFRDAADQIKAAVDKECAPLATEKARLKKLAGDWWLAEQKRQADERAEQDRLAQEAAAAAFAKQQEAQEAADALGMDAPPPQEIVVETPVLVQAPVGNAHSAVQMRVDFEVIDESKIPRPFLMFDPRTANAYKRDNKASIEARVAAGEGDKIVAGLRFTTRPDVAGR